ncbi:BadF/BadG/BcrA/BcrD ATPase family protein [Lederbergia citrea]|uniref:BadF/BadG/BcrA/BcrD ATPase family protein n=1 Tax=Lederbergia citrea TaxID=2833581 RepID=UPI001BC91D2A|nr:BadF/BadG/BcrA/BcrD ATPase family protein [Lederbergia citrea]MBS4204623.1 hypothetical protein [Lederbergia citrea]
MNLTIGIDAGGTKTTGLILDNQKRVVFQTESGYGNPNIHFDKAMANVWETVAACLASEYGKDCRAIVAGVAGIEAEGNLQRFEDFFAKKTDLPIIIVNDAVLAYHALLEGEDGILTIAGTGSISYGRKGESEGYAGGWGHFLGDPGSSYDIAIRVCREITREYDQGKPYSSLSQVIMREIGITDPNGLKGFIYNATKGEIASLSYPVFVEAEKGDESARKYFYEAGCELAEQTASLFTKLHMDSPLKVACKGSLLEKNSYVQSAFKNKLQTLVGEIEFIKNHLSPAVGALSVASLYLDQIGS